MHTPATEAGCSVLIKNNKVILIEAVARSGAEHFAKKTIALKVV